MTYDTVYKLIELKDHKKYFGENISEEFAKWHTCTIYVRFEDNFICENT